MAGSKGAGKVFAVPREIVGRLRVVCLELPEVDEQAAWTGVRWCVRRRNFAHVLMIQDDWPPAYARAANTPGPACVLTFRLPGEQCAAARFRRGPFFRPVWFPDIAGLVIDERCDWDEVDTLVRNSYRVLAPRRLADQVE